MVWLLSSGCVIKISQVYIYGIDGRGQGWQKADTVGRTNVDKRRQDFQSCGVKNFRDGSLDLNNRYPGMTSEDVSKRSKAIRSCMKNKGYIYLGETECVDGKNNKLTGLCN